MNSPRFRSPPPLQPAASARLDMLRLALVAQVILGHLAMIAFPAIPTLDLGRPADAFVAGFRLLTRFGGEAAFVFIAISGFLLGPRLLAIALDATGPATVRAFLAGRLKRIYPTLIAALLLTAAFDRAAVVWLGAEPLYRTVASYDAVARLTVPALLGNLASLQPTFAGAFGSNGPLWTLGYIVQFYVAASMLAITCRWNRRAALALLAVALVVALACDPQWGLLFTCWLISGAMRWFPARTAKAGWILAGAALVLFVVSNLPQRGLDVILAGAAGLMWLSALQAPFRPLGPDRLPRWLARINAASYPLYAFHFPLALFCFAVLLPRVDVHGLAFRAAWPLLGLAPGLIAALAWQAVLDRIAARGPRQ